MPHNVKMLLIEDNVSDAELIIESVKSEGLEPEWQRVVSRQE